MRRNDPVSATSSLLPGTAVHEETTDLPNPNGHIHPSRQASFQVPPPRLSGRDTSPPPPTLHEHVARNERLNQALTNGLAGALSSAGTSGRQRDRSQFEISKDHRGAQTKKRRRCTPSLCGTGDMPPPAPVCRQANPKPGLPFVRSRQASVPATPSTRDLLDPNGPPGDDGTFSPGTPLKPGDAFRQYGRGVDLLFHTTPRIDPKTIYTSRTPLETPRALYTNRRGLGFVNRDKQRKQRCAPYTPMTRSPVRMSAWNLFVLQPFLDALGPGPVYCPFDDGAHWALPTIDRTCTCCSKTQHGPPVLVASPGPVRLDDLGPLLEGYPLWALLLPRKTLNTGEFLT